MWEQADPFGIDSNAQIDAVKIAHSIIFKAMHLARGALALTKRAHTANKINVVESYVAKAQALCV